MLAGRSCCSALRPDLLRPPDNLCSSSSSRCLRLQTRSRGLQKCNGLMPVARPRLRPSTFALLTHGTIQDLSNNQVLVAVLTASLVGQLLKPFTAAIQGKGFNWKLAISSGGMPSAHSACVTAACTSIALERGLADSLFGMSVVFAGIVMYDAQGVRRAVGKQAEVINTLMVGTDPKPSAAVSITELQLAEGLMMPSLSSSQRSSSAMSTATDEQYSGGNNQHKDELSRKGPYNRSENFIEVAKKLPSVEAGDVNLQEIGDLDGWRHIPLKESVGHTKLEVIVGGLWGIISTLALSHVTEMTFFQTLHS